MTSEANPERNPSAEWSQQERINVAVNIIEELRRAARAGKYATPDILGDYSDRLLFILTMPPRFLEENREAILNGHPHPSFRFPSS